MSNPAPKKRFFHVLSFVGAIVGVLTAVTGWMVLSTPTRQRVGPGLALALGAAGVWISFAGWLVYRRAIDKGTDPKFSQALIWAGLFLSSCGTLAYLAF